MNLAMQPHTKPKVAMKKSGAAFESLVHKDDCAALSNLKIYPPPPPITTDLAVQSFVFLFLAAGGK